MKESLKNTTRRLKRISAGSIQHAGLASEMMAEALADMAAEALPGMVAEANCSAMRIS